MIRCTFENDNQASLRHVTVDAFVTRADELLLVKRANHLTEGGLWALPGGYLDRDETLFQGVQREVLEETGYQTKSVQLFRLNDNPQRKGEDRQNVDAIFITEASQQIGSPDSESSEIKWFGLDDLPDESAFAFDHFDNITRYKAWRETQHPLPILE